MSKIINDLTKVPNIIADLGLGIAAAQKQLNAGYLDALSILIAQAVSILHGEPVPPAGAPPAAPGAPAPILDANTRTFIVELLMNLAPPRYQFTQTDLSVKLDLSQSLNVSGQAGLGFSLGAFVVNAAFSAGYSSDYRGAAECKTVIHAILPTGDNKALFDALLKRAGELDSTPLTTLPRSEFDQKQLDATNTVMKALGVTPKELPPAPKTDEKQ